MHPVPWSIHASAQSRDLLIEVTGDIDAERADELLIELQRRRADGRTTTVDLGRVSFIDSVGLQALLSANGALNPDEERRLVLRNLPPAVSRALELAGLEDHFLVEGQRDQLYEGPMRMGRRHHSAAHVTDPLPD